MVNESSYKGKKTYRCDMCSFEYADKQTAQSCEDFCNTHKSCSFEITKKAIKRE